MRPAVTVIMPIHGMMQFVRVRLQVRHRILTLRPTAEVAQPSLIPVRIRRILPVLVVILPRGRKVARHAQPTTNTGPARHMAVIRRVNAMTGSILRSGWVKTEETPFTSARKVNGNILPVHARLQPDAIPSFLLRGVVMTAPAVLPRSQKMLRKCLTVPPLQSPTKKMARPGKSLSSVKMVNGARIPVRLPHTATKAS